MEVSTEMMDPDDRKRLQANFQAIVRDLLVYEVQDALFQNGILDEEDMELIDFKERGITPQAGNRRLIYILFKRGPHAFSCFCKALEESYPELATLIRNTDPSTVDSSVIKEVDHAFKQNKLQDTILHQTAVIAELVQEFNEFKAKKDKLDDVMDGRLKEKLDSQISNMGVTEKKYKQSLTDFFTTRVDDVDGKSTSSRYMMNWQSELTQANPTQPPNFTEVVARTLGTDVVPFISADRWYNKPPPCSYASTLRQVVKEVLDKYLPVFEEGLGKLQLTEVNGFQTLQSLADEIMSSTINWGRIIVLYAFGGWVARHYYQKGWTQLADVVGDFIGFYLARNHGDWIEAQGGWVSFLHIDAGLHLVGEGWEEFPSFWLSRPLQSWKGVAGTLWKMKI